MDTSHFYRQLRHAAHAVLVATTKKGTPCDRSLATLRLALDDIERAEFQILAGALGSIREITHAVLLNGEAAAHRTEADDRAVALLLNRHAEMKGIADRALGAVTSSLHLGEAPDCACSDEGQ